MDENLLYIGVGVLASGVLLAVLVRNLGVARTWRAGLEQIARTHRLKHVRPENAISKIYDLVIGEVDGYRVSINVDDESSFGSDQTTRYMSMSLSGRSRGGLKIGKPGTFDDPNVTDYSDEGSDRRVKIGDRRFDDAIELRNPGPKLLEALGRDFLLQQELIDLVEAGFGVDDGDTVLRTRSFRRTPALYLQQFEKLLALARRLDELS